MLVLSRTTGELIDLFDDAGTLLASVKVAKIAGDKVKLAFYATHSITIHRREVAEAIGLPVCLLSTAKPQLAEAQNGP